MSPFLAEFLGTTLLLLFGDGVVANVLLSRSKGINPARDLGPRLAHALLPIPGKGTSDWGYAWVPVIGPIIGGVVGAWVYVALWTA